MHEEILGILLALTAMFLGLALLGWTYGDFRKPPPDAPPPRG